MDHPLLIQLRNIARDTHLPGVIEGYSYLGIRVLEKTVEESPESKNLLIISVKTRDYGQATLEYNAFENTIRGRFQRRDNQPVLIGMPHKINPEQTEKFFHHWSIAGIRFLFGTDPNTPHWVATSSLPRTHAIYVQNRITGEVGIIPKATREERMTHPKFGDGPTLWPHPERVILFQQLNNLAIWLEQQGEKEINLRGLIEPALLPHLRNKIRHILKREPGSIPANDYARIEHLLDIPKTSKP
jgi:hypothetical protein